MIQKAITLNPEYRDYVWGGQRLRPGTLTAEAWVIYENDRIASGPLAGKTLAEATAEFGQFIEEEQIVLPCRHRS